MVLPFAWLYIGVPKQALGWLDLLGLGFGVVEDTLSYRYRESWLCMIQLESACICIEFASTIKFSPCTQKLCPCSITLILVVSDDAPSEMHSTYLLEVVFAAMVLLIGLHELEDISNKVERLKKELKVCFAKVSLIVYS